MITAVLVDLGGVLLHYNWKAISAHWDAELGLPPGGFLKALFGGSDDTVLVGRVPEDEWWEQVCGRLGGDGTLRARIEAFLAEHERYDVEVVQYLASLRPARRVGLVSNAWQSAADRARSHYRLHEVFDELIFSCEVGLAKADAAIYRLACERLEVQPSEAVFVDDSRANVDGALAFGMRGIVFDLPADGLRELREMLA